jgi:hypothetical protein
MTYRTGNVANIAPASNLIIKIVEPDMINAGWVKVSTNVVANQYIWNVYKSPGTNNYITRDWYLSLGWDNASNCNVLCTIFENWNSTTNTALGYPPNAVSGLVTTPIAGNANVHGTFSLNPSVLPNVTGSNIQYIATGVAGINAVGTTAMSTTANNIYFNNINIDRVILASQNANNQMQNGQSVFGYSFYAGTYDSFQYPKAPDIMPICMCPLGVITAGGTPTLPVAANNLVTYPVMYTREIGNFVSPFNSNFQGFYNYAYTLQNITNQVEQYSNQFMVARCTISGRFNNPSAVIGTMRGLLRDVYFCENIVLTATRGDLMNFVMNGNVVNTVSLTTGSSVIAAVGGTFYMSTN